MLDATLWTFIALIIFLGIVWYVGAFRSVGESLDDRGRRIAKEIDEARKLREEAQALLAQYQRRQREAEKEADDIVAQARAEAERQATEQRKQLADTLERRTKMAEDKIAQAEAQALADVRSVAASVAVSAARKIIQDKVDAGTDAGFIDASIAQVDQKLH